MGPDLFTRRPQRTSDASSSSSFGLFVVYIGVSACPVWIVFFTSELLLSLFVLKWRVRFKACAGEGALWVLRSLNAIKALVLSPFLSLSSGLSFFFFKLLFKLWIIWLQLIQSVCVCTIMYGVYVCERDRECLNSGHFMVLSSWDQDQSVKSISYYLSLLM